MFYQQSCLEHSFRVHGSAPTITVPDACAQKLKTPDPAPRALTATFAQTPVFYEQTCLEHSFHVHGSAPTITVPDACAQKLRTPAAAPRAPRAAREPENELLVILTSEQTM